MGKCTVIVDFHAKPGQGKLLGQALDGAVQHTVTFPNCYKAVLIVDEEDPDHLVMVEEWDQAQSHKDYAAKVMTDPKMEKVMTMMKQPPKFRYYGDLAMGGGQWGGPGHLEMSSNEVGATKKFLTDVFDWRFQPTTDDYQGFITPGAFMGGLRPTMDEEATPQTIPYLVVDDLEARVQSVQKAGGTIIVPIQTVPHAGRFFWFVEPGGLTLAVWESTTQP